MFFQHFDGETVTIYPSVIEMKQIFAHTICVKFKMSVIVIGPVCVFEAATHREFGVVKPHPKRSFLHLFCQLS